jgi:hypothetical protein
MRSKTWKQLRANGVKYVCFPQVATRMLFPTGA